jgi:hypothetical protein
MVEKRKLIVNETGRKSGNLRPAGIFTAMGAKEDQNLTADDTDLTNER